MSISESTNFELFCRVSDGELDRCERVTNTVTHENFYVVRDDTAEELREYQVHNLATCTCGEAECSHIALAKAADCEHRIAMALLGLQQAQAVLHTSGIKQHEVEMAQFTIECAMRELVALGVKLPTREEKWNIPAWMMRDPGPRVAVEDDPDID